MGSPKALLDFDGRPLWLHQMEKLQAVAPAELFISLPRKISVPPGGWTVLHDRTTGLGPLAGICSATEAMSADWLLVLAIDLAAMTGDYLRRLCVDATTAGVGQVPQLDDYYLGLAAVYPRAYLGRAQMQLQSEDRSVQRFVREGVASGFLAARPVLERERPLFVNVNDPEQLAHAIDHQKP